ncbi:hypothetical protein ACCS81_08335 [Rhizobium ruizarguesonis]
MIEPLRTGHPLSAFESVIIDNKRVFRARPAQDQRWEMERAVYMLEELLQNEATAHRKGLSVMIDWWAPQFMKCDAPELREKFATILAKAYRWRHLAPRASIKIAAPEA